MIESGTIVVGGGTGRSGGAYVRALLEAGYRVRASHRPGKDPSRAVASGAEAVAADLRDAGAVRRLVDGADAVFIAVLGRGPDAVAEEAAATRNLVDAARESGARRVVYTSVHRADGDTGVPHFEVKVELESYVRESGVPYTILRPATFMEFFDAPWVRAGVIERGVLASPIAHDTPISYVATADLARFAVLALTDARLDGATLGIGGPEALTYAEVLPIMSELTGREVRYERVPIEVVESQMGADMAAMMRFFNREGFGVDMAPVLERFPIELTTLRTHMMRTGWGAAG